MIAYKNLLPGDRVEVTGGTSWAIETAGTILEFKRMDFDTMVFRVIDGKGRASEIWGDYNNARISTTYAKQLSPYRKPSCKLGRA